MCGCAILFSGCAAGPDYVRPSVDLPPSWQLETPWRVATPADAAAKGAWWQRYGDPRLDALAQQALQGSPTLAAAAARLAQARALLAGTSAALLPQVGASARPSRLKISADRPLSNYNVPNVSTVQNDLVLAMTVGYEVDLAGRVQRSVEAGRATLAQTAADFENTRLLLVADLATNYFSLRAIDTELDVLGRSVALQRRAFDLVSARREGGAATGLDVAQQQALLDTTLVQLDLLRRQRSVYEHAVATLAGVPAPQFTLAADGTDLRSVLPPSLPLGLPSDVLERRPDIAAAERAMAAANAQIGVARAAFFPSVTLGATVGGESTALGQLLNAPSLLWSLGLSATQVLFDGGRIQAGVDFASAGYAAATANYRRAVLGAMQEVQDGISGLQSLDSAAAQAERAVTSARRVFEMSTARYEGGATAYLDVILAQQALLASERQAAQVAGQRLLTSVFLVKALGGDWERGGAGG
jgi:NodT family efflux transporter outer membrane factor (OMF) lipoprotein